MTTYVTPRIDNHIEVNIYLSRTYNDDWRAEYEHMSVDRCVNAYTAVVFMRDTIAEAEQVSLDEIVANIYINGNLYTGDLKDL